MEDLAAGMTADPAIQQLLREHAARVLEQLANEAHATGAGGVEPALNLYLGRMLRTQAAILRVPPAGAARAELTALAADTVWEYGFEADIFVPGLMHVTRNELLADTMHTARAEVPMYRRPATEWTPTNEVGA
jgi:hypothetical protein